MSQISDQILNANQAYVQSFGNKGRLLMPPARRFAILTCMDARIDPAKLMGLSEGDAHVIRNAGGRATNDAIRSLVISSKLLGTREWFVIHHTDCGMQLFTNEVMADLLSTSLESASYEDGKWRNPNPGIGSDEGRFFQWLTFTDPEKAVNEDVSRIRNHPLVSRAIPIHGYLYDVRTGKLSDVRATMQAGR
jgi:carbonic anhydrase